MPVSRAKQLSNAPRPPRLRIVRLFLITVFLVGGWLYASRDNIQNYFAVQNERDAERLRIEQLKQRLRVLNQRRQSLQLNGVESERQIREHLHYHLPGEQVVFIKDAATESKTSGTEASGKSLE